MNIRENIRRIRESKGLKQQVISDALGSDPAVASNIENGKREIKVSELERIAQALDEDVLYLFTYPERFVNANTLESYSQKKVSITFEVSPDIRDELLKIVTQK